VVGLWDIWNSLIRDVADFMLTCQARLGFITKLDLVAGGWWLEKIFIRYSKMHDLQAGPLR